MKKITTFLFIVLIALLLAACSSSNEQADSAEQELADQLFVFNWADYIPQEVIDDFEEEFGVEVVYSTFSSNQEMLTKVNSGTVAYDVIFPTDYFVEWMAEQGLLLELDLDNIPNFENIEEPFQNRSFDSENKYSVPFVYGSIGMMYNKEKVTEPPTSWEDLWNPDYAGKITVQETPRETVSMGLQLLGYDINEYTEEQIAEVKTKLEELHPNVLAYKASVAAHYINEEAWIGQVYSTQAGMAMKENPNIEYFLPEEGGILWMDNMAIPKTSKNKYTAEVFINYLLRPEVSKAITDYSPGSNPNGAAKELMSEEERNNPASYPEIPDNAVYFKYLEADELNMMNNLMKEVKVE